jgi:hypothetical protein
MPSDEEFLLYPLDTGQGPARLVSGMMRGEGAGSRRPVFGYPNILDSRIACGAAGGAIFGHHFQSRSFIRTGSDA